jgi:hypothetical protein
LVEDEKRDIVSSRNRTRVHRVKSRSDWQSNPRPLKRGWQRDASSGAESVGGYIVRTNAQTNPGRREG